MAGAFTFGGDATGGGGGGFNFGAPAGGAAGGGGGGFNFGAPAGGAGGGGGFNFGAPAGGAAGGAGAGGGGFNFGAPAAGAGGAAGGGGGGFNFGAPATGGAGAFNFGASGGAGGGGTGAGFGGFNFGGSTGGGGGGGGGGGTALAAAASGGGFSFDFGAGSGGAGASSFAPAGGASAAGGAGQFVDDPERKIQRIARVCHPQSPDCKFQFMFYNKVPPAEAARYSQPPRTVNAQQWRQAVRNNPDKENLVVCPAVGFADLRKRIQQQTQAQQFFQKQLQDIQREVTGMRQRHEEATKVTIAELRRRHLELSHRLLQVITAIELQQSASFPLLSEEVAFRNKLLSIKRELAKPAQFQARVHELASMVRMQEERPVDTATYLDPDNVARAHQFLDAQRRALKFLSNVVEEDRRDLGQMRQALSADAAATPVARASREPEPP